MCRIIFILCFSVSIVSLGQDVHFSQYYFSPLTLNPANTGNHRGDFRVFGNYRSQWREINRAYETFSAGGDLNFYPRNIKTSAGLVFLKDMSGGNLGVIKIMPSAACHLKLGGYRIHLGIQPGLFIKSLDFNVHTFPNQLNWDKGAFDNTLPNGESFPAQRFTRFDLNAGAGISRKFGRFEPEIGFAFFHLNKPVDSFWGEKDKKLPVRQAVNAGLGFFVTDNFLIKAYSLYGSTVKASDWVSGFNLEYILSETAFFTNSVFAGFMWRDGFKRNVDAGIVTAGFSYSHFTFGFSYDITISELKTSVDSKGAYEMAVIYRGISTRLKKKVIPCERY